MSSEAVWETHDEQGQLGWFKEHTLKDFEVLQIGIFRIDIELHSGHRYILCRTLAAFTYACSQEVLTKDAVVDLT